MNNQPVRPSRSQHQIIFKKFARHRNFSRSDPREKYIIESEAREIATVVSQRNVGTFLMQSDTNSSIVTLKFKQPPMEECGGWKLVGKGVGSRVDELRRRAVQKDIYLNNIRSLISSINFSSLKIASVELRRADQDISQRRSTRRAVDFDSCDDLDLYVKGVTKNMNNWLADNTVSSDRNTRFRKTAGCFRVKTQRNNLELGGGYSVQISGDMLRKPVLRKDHFVFGLADQADSLESKVENYRDFLWKVNYAHRMFVITPITLENCYRAYLGKGNNSALVRSLLKRRPWWTIVDTQNEANFVWTQLKINSYFEAQLDNRIARAREVYCLTSVKKIEEASTELDSQQSPIQDEYTKLFNAVDLQNWRDHFKRNTKTEQKIGESTYIKRVGLLTKKKLFKVDSPSSVKLQNHLIENYYIGNKKALFYNLKKYYDVQGKDVFQIIPITFHVKKGVEDPQFQLFLAMFQRFQEEKKTDRELRNVWIMKPGENTNRGNGITVCFGLDDVQFRLKSREKNKDGSLRTFILQKYIEKPLLYHGRKFDIRHYVLLTCFAGSVRAYWYEYGYVRTSSSPYSLRNGKDLFVHLTNDAIQKHGEGYGKYESGNKVSYEELEKYIAKLSRKDEKRDGKTTSFMAEMLPQMKLIAMEAVRATHHLVDKGRKEHNFELLGLDFMIDETYNVQLIEVNTNPCLQLSCPLLQTIIPDLIENTLRMAVDPIFPPPENIPTNKKGFFNFDNPILQNKFQLIFDEIIEGDGLRKLFQGCQKMDQDMGRIEQDDVLFENDGLENWQQTKK